MFFDTQLKTFCFYFFQHVVIDKYTNANNSYLFKNRNYISTKNVLKLDFVTRKGSHCATYTIGIMMLSDSTEAVAIDIPRRPFPGSQHNQQQQRLSNYVPYSSVCVSPPSIDIYRRPSDWRNAVQTLKKIPSKDAMHRDSSSSNNGNNKWKKYI